MQAFGTAAVSVVDVQIDKSTALDMQIDKSTSSAREPVLLLPDRLPAQEVVEQDLNHNQPAHFVTQLHSSPGCHGLSKKMQPLQCIATILSSLGSRV